MLEIPKLSRKMKGSKTRPIRKRELENLITALEDGNSFGNFLVISRYTVRIEIPPSTASSICANLQNNITSTDWAVRKMVRKFVLGGLMGRRGPILTGAERCFLLC